VHGILVRVECGDGQDAELYGAQHARSISPRFAIRILSNIGYSVIISGSPNSSAGRLHQDLITVPAHEGSVMIFIA
jgi:hypothetical protein